MDKKELQIQLGSNVRRYRLERKLTQEALASQVNINASAITRIEGGQRMVSVPTLRALAEALGVSCDSLPQAERTPSVHKSNINFMLDRQSETSLAHLERVLQVCISEYGDATEEEM